MIDYWQLVLLGAIAGFTIFLGLPLAAFQSMSARKKGFLNAFAIGILIFLIIDVFGQAWESASTTASAAATGKVPMGDAALALFALFGGLAIGLLGLVWYETKYMKKGSSGLKKENSSSSATSTFSSSVSRSSHSIDGDPDVGISTTEAIVDGGYYRQQHHQQLIHQANAYKIAMMIAIGIGAHNFSEGLAIGQSYASGAISLAILLIVGFGLHNATEGFGIAGPLTGLLHKPRIKFLILAGLIGGGPTFLGTIVGSLWTSPTASILFLSIAGGALIYVTLLMYNSGRRQNIANNILMVGIFLGLCAGFVTDLVVTVGGA
jgi:zinc transporter, ZIP family